MAVPIPFLLPSPSLSPSPSPSPPPPDARPKKCADDPLNVAVIGGGPGGVAAALALRRSGHRVTIYERYDYSSEVGASISCAANGGRWLREWGVPIEEGSPVTLKTLIMHDWVSGDVINEYPLTDYKERWGIEYYMFHRQDLHRILQKTAFSDEGEGPPVKLRVNHQCESVDACNGRVTFTNGVTIEADLIVGADGIRSKVREQIGIVPRAVPSNAACYRCNILRSDVDRLGLAHHGDDSIEYWGGFPDEKAGRSQYFKIVLSGCRGGEVMSFYCFMPQELSPQRKEGFRFAEVPVEEITGPFRDLDPACRDLIAHSFDRMPWRLYVHEPYPYWTRSKVCLLGDAAHPMLPNQSQGACQALEDAAALGLIFSPDGRRRWASGPELEPDVGKGLELYEGVRKPRATRVQWASYEATEDMGKRIGFSSTPYSQEKHKDSDVLTVDEMNLYDMRKDIEYKSELLDAVDSMRL